MGSKANIGAASTALSNKISPYLQAQYQFRLAELERKNRLADLLVEKRQTGIDEGSYIPAPKVQIGTTTDKLSLLPGMQSPTVQNPVIPRANISTSANYPSTIQPGATFRLGGEGYMPKPVRTKWEASTMQEGLDYQGKLEKIKTDEEIRKENAKNKTKPPFDPTSATGLNVTTQLRKEYNDIVKDYRTVREKYKGMELTYQNAMKLGDDKSRQFADQAMIIGLNKMLDPSSVVRESEYARTPEGLSAFNRLQGYFEKLQKGGSGLTDADRTDLMETSRMLFQAAEETYNQQRSNYSKIAAQYGVPEELVLGEDLSISKKKAKDVQQDLLNSQGKSTKIGRFNVEVQ